MEAYVAHTSPASTERDLQVTNTSCTAEVVVNLRRMPPPHLTKKRTEECPAISAILHTTRLMLSGSRQ